MRYTRLSLLLVISLVFLLLVSLGLIVTWFYYYFYNKKEETVTVVSPLPDSAANHTRDSLNKVYTATINDLNSSLDSVWNNPDSISSRIDSKLNEFHKLKREIGILLSNNGSSGDMDSARQKISMLQQTIEALRLRTKNMELENRRLNQVVKQLSSRLQVQPRKNKVIKASQPIEKVTVSSNAAASPNFMADEISFGAWTDENPTEEAEKTNRLSGSITVKNNFNSLSGVEIFIVVLQPDGRVLLNSDWETGTFETSEGKKIYSYRIPFDYAKGEFRKLSFSIHTSDLQKGEYRMQVYHNGMMIGNGSKVLR